METTASDHIFDVSEAEFEQKVLAASAERPVVVDFWAPWCRPCLMLGPVLERAIAGRAGTVVLAKVNIDEAQSVAARYRIDSIPAVIAFKDGRPSREFVGVLPEEQINAFLDLLKPSECRSARERGERVGSERAIGRSGTTSFARQLERDPRRRQFDARLGLAELLLQQGKMDGVTELLDAVSPGGELGEQARRLTARAVLRQQLEGLGDVKAARSPSRSRAEQRPPPV